MVAVGSRPFLYPEWDLYVMELSSILSSTVVSQIKAYVGRGVRVGEIAASFHISRQAVAKIVSGRTHTRVAPARSVPTIEKMAEIVAERLREAERQAEIERRRALK